MNSTRLKNWPKDERPRERLLSQGPGRLTDAELLAIVLFNKTHAGSSLLPISIDKQHGASFDIPARVFQEIDDSRLLIADLTDEKPNVYCEVGYAKARGIPFFLTFHQEATKEAKPTKKPDHLNKVHFDLAPLKYIAYEDPLDLRDKLRGELEAWHASRA